MIARILVVEDDAHNAILFRKVLEKRLDAHVTVTESPEIVFQMLRDSQVDLVVLDISLNNSTWQGRPLNGVEICQLMKSDPCSAMVPVLLATAHAMRGDAEMLLAESGADDYVSKPIVDHAAFVDQVRGLLEQAA